MSAEARGEDGRDANETRPDGTDDPGPGEGGIGEGPVGEGPAEESPMSEGLAGAVGETLGAVGETLGRAGQALRKGPVGRRRRLRRLARSALSLLYDVHPEARRALPRPRGLRTIPLTEIAGTAVEPSQRGGDFLPLRDRRSMNWEARWQRIREANARLDSFPPIEVLHYGDRYWVVDGHNRVAVALQEDQVGIDAEVTELHLPGQATERAAPLAPTLGASQELRGAARGRLVREAEPRAEPGDAGDGEGESPASEAPQGDATEPGGGR